MSVTSFYNKTTAYISPHQLKKIHSNVECKIIDFDISDPKEKDKEKIDEIQDIKSQAQEDEEASSPDVQGSENDKTLDEHSEGKEWWESREYVDLSDDGDVRISRSKLCTNENSNKKIKERVCWHKRVPTVVDSTFHGK